MTPAATSVVGPTAAERLPSFCRRVAELWPRNTNLMAAMHEVRIGAGGGDVGIVGRSVATGHSALYEALDGIDEPFRSDAVTIMDTTFRGAMAALTAGVLTIDELEPLLETAVRRLAEHPAMDGHRPKSWTYSPGRRLRR